MPDKYERTHDSLEATLRDTHETVGRLKALMDDLTLKIDELKGETGRRGPDGEIDGRRK